MSTDWMHHDRIDCHVHVLDPKRFAYAANAPFHPGGGETGSAAYLGRVLDAHRIQHALIVGPNSGYNLDKRCLLDALAQGAGRYKGMAVFRSYTSGEHLQELQAQGRGGRCLPGRPVWHGFLRRHRSAA